MVFNVPTRKMRGGENTEQEGSMQDGLHAPNSREGLQCTYTLRWLAALVCYAPGHPFECCRARQAPRYRISGKSKDKDFFFSRSRVQSIRHWQWTTICPPSYYCFIFCPRGQNQTKTIHFACIPV